MQPLTQFVPRALADLLRPAPLSAGKVDFAWRTSVGPNMARVSHVRLEGGVLLVEAQTPHWASAVMRATPLILPRMQALLGAEQIREIRLRG